MLVVMELEKIGREVVGKDLIKDWHFNTGLLGNQRMTGVADKIQLQKLDAHKVKEVSYP